MIEAPVLIVLGHIAAAFIKGLFSCLGKLIDYRKAKLFAHTR